ncbi:MAG: class B sortase [Clostridiales Family XIII bacterium]|jgi:sortase B|nr:class B sortase [Clostridiales Family XIII bacterium]
MNGQAGAARKAIRVFDSIVNMAILLTILLLLAIGGYAMWDSGHVYDEASAKRYEAYRPGDEGEALSFAELQALNDDVFAWLTVYGTHINYPVVQGEDNMEYVNTDAEGRYSLTGSIFLDEGSSRDFSDFSSILYGHHMEKNAMFGEIGQFANEAYFDSRRYGALYYGGRWHGLEFFAFLQADAYDGEVFRVKIVGPEEQAGYLDMLLSMAVNIRDLPVAAEDRIVLLSTCSPGPTNGRDILVAKITDEVRGDPFSSDAGERAADDPLMKVLTPVLAVLYAAVLALVFLIRRRRDRRGYEEG